MNHHFFSAIAGVLTDRGLRMLPAEDESGFSGQFTVTGGVEISLSIAVIANTRVIHVIATLPVPVLPSRRASVVRILNTLNRPVPCGAFVLDPDDGQLSLRSSGMIPEDTDPAAQLDFLLSLNAAIVHRHALPLVRLAVGGMSVRAALAAIADACREGEPEPEPDLRRFRWN